MPASRKSTVDSSVPKNYAELGEAFEIMKRTLAPLICKRLENKYGESWWIEQVLGFLHNSGHLPEKGTMKVLSNSLDVQKCLILMGKYWDDLFGEERRINKIHRGAATALHEYRNRLAHAGQDDLAEKDLIHALSLLETLLEPIHKKSSEDISRMLRRPKEAKPKPQKSGPERVDEEGDDILFQKAAPIRPSADIVFCIDVTGSMRPCVDGLLTGVGEFVSGLHSAAAVDYRVRIIAYRDLHDGLCSLPWKETEFTGDIAKFKRELKSIRVCPCTNECQYGAESTLDALYRALDRSKWRTGKVYRSIVLLTDDDTHPRLHSSTYSRPDGDIGRVIQAFQEMRDALLFMVAPNTEAYTKLDEAHDGHRHKVFWKEIPSRSKGTNQSERLTPMKDIDWSNLLGTIGKVISSSTVKV